MIIVLVITISVNIAAALGKGGGTRTRVGKSPELASLLILGRGGVIRAVAVHSHRMLL